MKWMKLPWKRTEPRAVPCVCSINMMSDEQTEQILDLLRKAIRQQGGDVQTVLGR